MAAEALAEEGLRVPSATDFLQGFEVAEESVNVSKASDVEVEAELGLTLGGCFAEKREKELVRELSIEGLIIKHGDDGVVTPIASMPMEREEVDRKRKGKQSLKRTEAKRRRLERRDRNGVAPAELALPVSQRSVGSHHSHGSSGVSDLDWQHEGLSNCKEAGSPASIPSSHNEASLASHEEDNASKRIVERAEKGKEMGRNMMEEMPCVSTRGDGPNGRTIQGFLYKYGNDREVRIVCVCHGSFLTPGEFVKHAGGTDVAHPLRHIVVSRSSFS